MGLFYDRTESGGKTFIVYKYWALFYHGLAGTIVLSFIFGKWSIIIGVLFAVFIIILLLDLWKPTKDKKSHEKRAS